MIRVLKSRLLEYGRVSVLHGVTYVFMKSFFIFTPGEISDPVVFLLQQEQKDPGDEAVGYGFKVTLMQILKSSYIF